MYAYDFAANSIPGLQEHEEPGYWRDVGTLAALAGAQQDAIGNPPRSNLWNRRWPIRGALGFEHAEFATNDPVTSAGIVSSCRQTTAIVLVRLHATGN